MTDPKIRKDKEFINTFEEIGFLYTEMGGLTLMEKEIADTSYRSVAKHGKGIFFYNGRWDRFTSKDHGIYLSNFTDEIKPIIAHLDEIFQYLNGSKYEGLGLMNKRIKLSDEIVYISSTSRYAFSTISGVIQMDEF